METIFSAALHSLEARPLKPITESDIYHLLYKQVPKHCKELRPTERAELVAFRFMGPGGKLFHQQRGHVY